MKAPLSRIAPALRFVAVYGALTALMFAFGESYARLWCKPVEHIIGGLASTFVADTVTVARSNDQRLFVLKARTRNVIHTPRGIAPAGAKFRSTTLQAYAHHHLILILAALAAWPVRSVMQRAVLLAAGIPAVALATLSDLPFTLLGVAQDAVLALLDPQAARDDMAVLYFQFLQRGGRQVLSLIAAALAIVCVVATRFGFVPGEVNNGGLLLSQNHHAP